ncbi:hypothetical protein I3843_02G116700 [Carya illinoinensis]|nr:uncharacterized protein LOC122300929 [Carya illinoinensis]KAG7992217.1 hypothetical protein I3843_02G116700 [Carya illinoinensis]
MEEDEDMHPPFWLQTTDNPRSRHRPSSRFLNSGLLLLLLLVIALFFFFVVIPSFLSSTSQIFRPHLVKKRWDSLNLFLVLFAIACGFLSRNTNNYSNNESSSYEDPSILNALLEANKSNPSTPHRWYELYADRSTAGHNDNHPMINRLRSSSSYPDLRQESAWVTVDERGRFYDDAQVSSHRFPGSDQVHYGHSRPEPQAEEEEEENSKTKTIDQVDTFVVYTEQFSSNSHPPPLPRDPRPPSPPQTAPPKLVKRRAKRTSYQALGEYHHEKIENLGKNDSEEAKNLQTLQSPPPPPLFQHTEEASTGGKNEKKRSSEGSSGAKDFLSSMRRRKKKQRQKSFENFDTILEPQPTSYLPLYPPPSPPPSLPSPPPPSSVFHILFSTKKGKTKQVKSDASPAPPPLPPARAKIVRAASTTKSGRGPITASKSPLPVKTNSFSGGNGNLRSCNESPLVPTPPSLPPFRMWGSKFVVHGDFVGTKSNTSSRSVSQGVDDDEEGNSSRGAAGKDGPVPTTMPMICPSPDVNTKADTFIAKFRAGLELEKMNSINERQGRGKFNTGPGQSPDAETVQGTGPIRV